MVENWNWFYERAKARDQAEASLADTLDVKASILLVLIVFLATLIPDVLRTPALPTCIQVLQVVTAVILSAGVVALTIELWPRKYRFEDERCLTELYDYLRQNQEEINEQITVQMLQNASAEAMDRVKRNCELNSLKQLLLKISAWLAISGLIFQILIFLILAA